MNTPKLPKVNVHKNGYEIRTEILDMAKDYVMMEYQARLGEYEVNVTKDQETGEMVTSVKYPSFPTMLDVMEVAKQFYQFVDNKKD